VEDLKPDATLPGAAPSFERRRNLVFSKGYCTMGCHILDISETGALLKPSDIFLCPNEFVLKPDIGSPRDCEVVWRKGEMVGVRFV
jgi:hypothetical protein